MARMAETSAIDPARKKDMPVMGALRRQKGEAPEGGKYDKPTTIIQEALRRDMPGQDIQKMMIYVAYMVKQKNTKLLQIGNTVFLVQLIGPNTAQFHTFTTEPLNVLPDRYIAGAKALKSQAIKNVIILVDNPVYVRMAQQIQQKTGMQINVTQSTMQKGNQMVPAYRIEVVL